MIVVGGLIDSDGGGVFRPLHHKPEKPVCCRVSVTVARRLHYAIDLYAVGLNAR
jgi:hypothetical protein